MGKCVNHEVGLAPGGIGSSFCNVELIRIYFRVDNIEMSKVITRSQSAEKASGMLDHMPQEYVNHARYDLV